jgi:drug/metabolite transporter (DMT)-like permease
MTPIITFTTACGGTRIEHLETRLAGCMAAMAEIPRNRRRWVLPAALVVVGVLMMVIGSFRQGGYASAIWLQLGSALALFGALYGAQRMLERGSPERVPRLFVVRHRRAGE